eukprot:TRINITY_DN267_c0_g1_i1.p1 TRINITY_DN267_c0_g1~~TRINITY_DN267_c0_g1_i1.p1  ORF type:complete len:196 (+),score=16.78 TRINITY_DN267_c0_g1_i1:123-710(+)
MSTTNNCTLRWTGENCTTDHFVDIGSLVVIGIWQFVFLMSFSSFFVYAIWGMIRKSKGEGTKWYSLSFFSFYMVLLGVASRIIWFIDPLSYFDSVEPVLRDCLYWFGTNSLFGGAVLAYAIWLEVVLTTKSRLKPSNVVTFRVAKTSFVVYVFVGLGFYIVALLITSLLGAIDAFDSVMVLIAIPFSFFSNSPDV